MVLVTTIDEIEDLPKLSLRAGISFLCVCVSCVFNYIKNIVHASLRDDVELQPHQVDGINTMIQMEKAYRGGILADEMGLGKVPFIYQAYIRQK